MAALDGQAVLDRGRIPDQLRDTREDLRLRLATLYGKRASRQITIRNRLRWGSVGGSRSAALPAARAGAAGGRMAGTIINGAHLHGITLNDPKTENPAIIAVGGYVTN